MKTPQLRIVTTPYCNLKCIFCRPGGEGYYQNPNFTLSGEQIIKIVNAAANVGFTHIKFTGGEPLLRDDIFFLIQESRKIDKIKEIQLVTNGQLLSGKAQNIKKYGVDLLTISLDALNENKYKAVRGVSNRRVIDAIKECFEISMPVRINMVVTKDTINEIPAMIEFCTKYKMNLKLLDLIFLQEGSSIKKWEFQYQNFDAVRDILISMGYVQTGKEEAAGGIGSPLQVFSMKSSCNVLLKDSTQGTFYNKKCEDCNYYPCQDAVISVRITHDGHIKRCLFNNENLVNLNECLINNDILGLEKVLKETFDLMINSKYYQHKWYPELIERRT